MKIVVLHLIVISLLTSNVRIINVYPLQTRQQFDKT